MIISDEQARLAAQALKSSPPDVGSAHSDISPEFLEEVRLAVRNAPETRSDRVAQAVAFLDSGIVDSRMVAHMMISRAICDSLR
jgi:hypothetical protein